MGVNDKGEDVLLKLQVPPLTEFITAYNSRFRSFTFADTEYRTLMQFPTGGKGQVDSVYVNVVKFKLKM